MSKTTFPNPQDVKAGYAWMLGAIVILAIFIIPGLISVDNYLTNSDREQVLGETLHELRGSQSGLKSGVTDWRQTNGPVLRALPQIADEHAVESEHGEAHTDSHDEHH